MDEATIEALKNERAGYVARGLTERVAQVDRALGEHAPRPVVEATTFAPAEKRGPGRPRKD